MIAILDYGSGNLRSMSNALELLGADVKVTGRPDDLRAAERLILPGVGAFGQCVDALRASGLVEALEDEVRRGKPMLGVCVGMQVLAARGLERGEHRGLGWFDGHVAVLEPPDEFKLPHVGWNEIEIDVASPMFAGLRAKPAFYFVHSYAISPADTAVVAARAHHGVPFVAAISRGNVFGTQFHPEKSQQNGLRLLENFLGWTP